MTGVAAARCGDTSPWFTTWDGVSDHALARALVSSATKCLEVGLTAPRAWLAPQPRPNRDSWLDRDDALGLSPFDRQGFVAALTNRLDISRDLGQRLHTALHEAIINAVVHGNLRLDSPSLENRVGSATVHEMITNRLDNEKAADKSIRVNARWTATMLRIAVRYRGAGFNKSVLPSPDERYAAARVASGNGLEIIAAFSDRVALHRRGVTIEMGFDLPAIRP